MIINCIGIGADEEEIPNRLRFRGLELESSATSFLVCSSTFSFVSILEFVLHSISSYFKFYDHCSTIEIIFNKLHIEVF